MTNLSTRRPRFRRVRGGAADGTGRRQLRSIAVVFVSLALLATAACASSSPPPKVGVVADSGFSPSTNGFTFQNYGDVLSDGAIPSNLTPADVKALFGDGVCADAAIGKCDLIPQAQAWMNQINQEMAGGHCFGFSVAAELVWQHKMNPSTYGAPAIDGLTIDNNTALQSTIAHAWVLQTLDSEQAHKITGTPNNILDKLKKVLKPHPSDTYTVAIWKSDGTGGHAVTPYEVSTTATAKYEVLIYDNNWPGQTRAIAFDTNKDTWSLRRRRQPQRPDRAVRGGRQHQDHIPVPHLARQDPAVPVLRHGVQAGLHGGHRRGGAHGDDLPRGQRHQPLPCPRHRPGRPPSRLRQRPAG